MNYLLGFYAEYKIILLYVLVLALLRGVFFSDFRYGLISMVVIQVLFPLMLCYVFFMGEVGNKGYIQKVVICIVGIVASELISIVVYNLLAGPGGLKDQVSIALFIGSFIGQVVIFLLIVALLMIARKG